MLWFLYVFMGSYGGFMGLYGGFYIWDYWLNWFKEVSARRYCWPAPCREFAGPEPPSLHLNSGACWAVGDMGHVTSQEQYNSEQ